MAEQRRQHQGALSDQLRELIQVANREGLYDAADWIQHKLDPDHNRQESLNQIERITDGS